MFNIVRRRDLMLAEDLPTLKEAERLRMDKYGHDYIVVSRTDKDHDATKCSKLGRIVHARV